MKSERYAAAKRAVLATLARTAREGRIETLFAFDRESGEQLTYAEATPDNPDEVSMDAKVLTGHANVAVLHNHRDSSPPSADDWANFLNAPSFQEMVVVTSMHAFTLIKPAEWVASRRMVPYEKTFFLFLAKIELLRRASAPVGKFVDLAATMQEELLWDTNQWLAVRFGIQLKREDTP